MRWGHLCYAAQEDTTRQRADADRDGDEPADGGLGQLRMVGGNCASRRERPELSGRRTASQQLGLGDLDLAEDDDLPPPLLLDTDLRSSR